MNKCSTVNAWLKSGKDKHKWLVRIPRADIVFNAVGAAGAPLPVAAPPGTTDGGDLDINLFSLSLHKDIRKTNSTQFKAMSNT